MNETSVAGRGEDPACRVEARIQGYGAARAIIAFSGGVDSSVVVALAARALGSQAVTAVTAISPSYPAGELGAAQAIANQLGVRHETLSTREVELELYARNGPMRCFHCKVELFAALQGLARAYVARDTVVLAGANMDDTGDFRPGLLAARRFKVRNPLLEERITKTTVRVIARQLGLAVAEKPAMACLSSRVAYGIRITRDLLARIDRAEQLVRRRGFASVRVRHLGEAAAIEVLPTDMGRLMTDPGLPELMATLRGMGWSRIVVDPQGLRSGSMNATLKLTPALRRTLKRISERRVQPQD